MTTQATGPAPQRVPNPGAPPRHPLAEKPPTTGLDQAKEQFRTLIAADFPKNPFPSQKLTVAIWRANQVLFDQPGIAPLLLRRVVRFVDALWVRGVIGAELPPQVWAGPGLRLPHAGRGIILHPSVRIGSGATIYHQVTIGVKDGINPPAILGDDVHLGAGAKVIGPVYVADGTSLGANAVLTKSTEPGKTYVGMPARELTPKGVRA